jgi:hypothetical protein
VKIYIRKKEVSGLKRREVKGGMGRANIRARKKRHQIGNLSVSNWP